MWYIYTMEYYSAIKRNKIGSFVEIWMDLETVIQSEVSQEEKNKYNLLMHIYGIQKDGTDESVHRASNGDTDVENRPMWGGEEEEGEMYGESNMETYNTIRKIDSHWEFAT